MTEKLPASSLGRAKERPGGEPSDPVGRRLDLLAGALSRAALICAALSSACPSASPDAPPGSGASPVASAPGTPPSLALSERELTLRREMFAGLVSDIRKYHVFSSVWPEAQWAKELPALEREVTTAPGRDGLLLSLRHVSNSLRDGHLAFTPSGSDGAERFITLPTSFASLGDVNNPWFVVVQSDRQSGLSLGDYLLTYDGVPREELLEHYRFELNAATPAARTAQLSEFLRRRSTVGQSSGGMRVAATLRHGAHVVNAELVFEPPAPSPSTRPEAVQRRTPCPEPAREYDAAYELVQTGAHICLYRASHGPFAAYPIIRQRSFLYQVDELAADRDLIRALIASIPHLAGVVLDLRSNGGGIAAEYFLPWYAPGPYQEISEWVHVHPELSDRARLRRTLRSEAAVDEYLRRASHGDRWWVRPFDCGSDPCPSPAEPPLVGTAPVALLLGPGCRSACDQFAAIWIRERFGPSIGSAPAGMYTSLRYPLELELGGVPLGELSVAFCGLRFQESDPWIEGQVLPVGTLIEPTWPSAGHGAKLLRAALDALRGWRAQPAAASAKAP